MSDAVSRFLERLGAAADGPVPELPLRVDVAAMTAERAADLGLFLALIALVYLGFRLLRDAALPNLRPYVGTSVVLAAVMFGAMDEGLWNLAGLDADAAGLTMRRHVGADVRLPWADVASVRFDRGDPWPVVTDDARLVLAAADDGPVVNVPSSLPDAAGLARLIARKVASAAASGPVPEERDS